MEKYNIVYIDELELSVRSYNCLKRVGINTIADLVKMSASDLRGIKNLSQNCIEEICEGLREHGLSLLNEESEGEMKFKEQETILYKGKATCEFLKKIRKEIAEKNDIVYLTAECTYQGDCSGTCSKCDAEIAYLQEQIDRRIANKQPVNVAGISLNIVKTLTNRNDMPLEKKHDCEDDLDYTDEENPLLEPSVGAL